MKYLIIVLVISAVGIAIYFTLGTKSNQYEGTYSQEIESIRLGVYKGEFSSLIFIAEAEGFFESNFLKAEITKYDSGVKPMLDLIEGKVDVVTSGEFVVASHSFANPDLRVITAINELKAIELIAPESSGIKKIGDIKGKTIGLKKKSQAEYVLWEILLHNSLNLEDVTIIDLDPDKMEKALKDNIADAVVVWDPYTLQLKNSLAGSCFCAHVKDGNEFNFLLTTKENYSKNNKSALVKLLAALYQAEEFAYNNPSEAKNIVSNSTGLTLDYINSVWDKQKLSLTLHQYLFTILENEAKWMINNSLTKENSIPDYSKYIIPEYLEIVKPNGITIIR